MPMITRMLTGLALLFSQIATSQAALMDGQAVRLTYEWPGLGIVVDSREFFVGPWDEAFGFPSEGQLLDVDLSDSNILVRVFGETEGRFNPDFPFNGIHVTDLFGTIPAFATVSIDTANTQWDEFDASRISFDADNIYVNFRGLPYQYGFTRLSLDVSAVPEPSTLLLLGVGLAVLGIS